jgi:hypothetical protein
MSKRNGDQKSQVRVQTTEKPRPKAGAVGAIADFLYEKAGPLVPHKPARMPEETVPPAPAPSRENRSDRKSDLPASPLSRSVRSSTGLSTTDPRKLAEVSTAESNTPRTTQSKLGSSRFRNLALAALILLIGYALLTEDGQQRFRSVFNLEPFSKYSKEEVMEIVDFHRFQTGTRLNRERVKVQFENALTAPPLEATDRKVPMPDQVMKGLPLQGETHHRQSSRDRLVPVDPDYPDARAMYSLQEEKDARDFERLAYRQYVREFIANAAKAGYKVEVDPHGEVRVVGRIPASGRPQDKPFQYDDDFDAQQPHSGSAR